MPWILGYFSVKNSLNICGHFVRETETVARLKRINKLNNYNFVVVFACDNWAEFLKLSRVELSFKQRQKKKKKYEKKQRKLNTRTKRYKKDAGVRPLTRSPAAAASLELRSKLGLPACPQAYCLLPLLLQLLQHTSEMIMDVACLWRQEQKSERGWGGEGLVGCCYTAASASSSLTHVAHGRMLHPSSRLRHIQ